MLFRSVLRCDILSATLGLMFALVLLCKCLLDGSSLRSTSLLTVQPSCECIPTYYFHHVSFFLEHSRVSALHVIHFKADQSIKPTVFSNNSGLVSSTLGTRIAEHEATNPGQSKPLVHSRRSTQIVRGFTAPSNSSNIRTLHPIAHNLRTCPLRNLLLPPQPQDR